MLYKWNLLVLLSHWDNFEKCANENAIKVLTNPLTLRTFYLHSLAHFCDNTDVSTVTQTWNCIEIWAKTLSLRCAQIKKKMKYIESWSQSRQKVVYLRKCMRVSFQLPFHVLYHFVFSILLMINTVKRILIFFFILRWILTRRSKVKHLRLLSLT